MPVWCFWSQLLRLILTLKFAIGLSQLYFPYILSRKNRAVTFPFIIPSLVLLYIAAFSQLNNQIKYLASMAVHRNACAIECILHIEGYNYVGSIVYLHATNVCQKLPFQQWTWQSLLLPSFLVKWSSQRFLTMCSKTFPVSFRLKSGRKAVGEVLSEDFRKLPDFVSSKFLEKLLPICRYRR